MERDGEGERDRKRERESWSLYSHSHSFIFLQSQVHKLKTTHFLLSLLSIPCTLFSYFKLLLAAHTFILYQYSRYFSYLKSPSSSLILLTSIPQGMRCCPCLWIRSSSEWCPLPTKFVQYSIKINGNNYFSW